MLHHSYSRVRQRAYSWRAYRAHLHPLELLQHDVADGVHLLLRGAVARRRDGRDALRGRRRALHVHVLRADRRDLLGRERVELVGEVLRERVRALVLVLGRLGRRRDGLRRARLGVHLLHGDGKVVDDGREAL